MFSIRPPSFQNKLVDPCEAMVAYEHLFVNILNEHMFAFSSQCQRFLFLQNFAVEISFVFDSTATDFRQIYFSTIRHHPKCDSKKQFDSICPSPSDSICIFDSKDEISYQKKKNLKNMRFSEDFINLFHKRKMRSAFHRRES